MFNWAFIGGYCTISPLLTATLPRKKQNQLFPVVDVVDDEALSAAAYSFSLSFSISISIAISRSRSLYGHDGPF